MENSYGMFGIRTIVCVKQNWVSPFYRGHGIYWSIYTPGKCGMYTQWEISAFLAALSWDWQVFRCFFPRTKTSQEYRCTSHLQPSTHTYSPIPAIMDWSQEEPYIRPWNVYFPIRQREQRVFHVPFFRVDGISDCLIGSVYLSHQDHAVGWWSLLSTLYTRFPLKNHPLYFLIYVFYFAGTQALRKHKYMLPGYRTYGARFNLKLYGGHGYIGYKP